jgi:hypothetical protein
MAVWKEPLAGDITARPTSWDASDSPTTTRCAGLSFEWSRLRWRAVKEKRNLWLPVLLMLVFALTRWPGLLPPSFSAAYALVFCAGVYFPKRWAWWLPMATLFATDLLINVYFLVARDVDAFKPTMLVNYAAYAAILWLGQRFRPTDSWAKLLSGGLLGAILFYLITNTAAWLFNPFGNPEYTKNLMGWIIALTKGTAGWPESWEFFRNTLSSGGLFTGLFVGAMKVSERAESAREKEAEEEPEEAEPSEPEEAKA